MLASPTDITLISRLIDAADKAAAAGQQREALQLLGEAQAAAPRHPRVLSALGLYALKAGDLTSARRYLSDAVAADAQSALLWFHLALICRAQGDTAAELTALDRSLVLDPQFYLALLQKATLLERQGKPRQAAQVFIYFLHWVPPSAQQPPELKQAVHYAQTAVDADKAALGAFIRQRLESIPAAHGDQPQERFEHCLDVLLGRRRVYTPKPTFMHFPRLPALEFYDRQDFPWLDAFESATDAIRDELVHVVSEDLSEGDIVPYVAYPDGVPLDQWRDLNRSLQWGAYYLLKNGVRIEDHLARCPQTAALLAAAPLADVPGNAPTAFFSLLKPKTRIPPHTGVTNTRLVVHVPLIVPLGCGFRVGSDTREWQLGRAWVFDDTIEHEAWNDSDEPRAILIIDIWNPFLTAAERALVSATTVAVADFQRE
jgi:aspartyl/asparaginyl beta-hydroxylase (cupin superfamily)/Tfp pilus assembly protein PilF